MTQDLDSMELEHMENINTVGSTATRKVAGMTGRTKGILFFWISVRLSDFVFFKHSYKVVWKAQLRKWLFIFHRIKWVWGFWEDRVKKREELGEGVLRGD